MTPKVLILDIETAPILGYVWQLWDQTLGLEQVHTDWYVLSWSAKWLGDKKVMYMDQRHAQNMEDDSVILGAIWQLLNEADVIVTQNGKKFDVKKLNARFILNGFKPPSSFKHIDTLAIAKKSFGFTSNKLAYMTDKLCTKYKKLTHSKFPGFLLWRECLAGNKQAWAEMERYNKHDVLALEELYSKLIPWDNSVNFNLYHNSGINTCTCGSKETVRNGFHYTPAGKFQRYRCAGCGKESRATQNLFTAKKKASLRK